MPLEHGHFRPGLGQQHRRRQATWPCADHRNPAPVAAGLAAGGRAGARGGEVYVHVNPCDWSLT